MKKGLVIVITLVFICLKNYGQDPIFSQFYANRLYLNPAFAGTAKCPRFTLNYRNQWPGIDNSFITSAASFDKQVDAIQGGIGVQVLTDRAGEGVLNTTQASFIYSYQAKVNRKFSIRAGFQATAVQKSININNLRFGDMIDARRGVVYQTQEQINSDNNIFPDFSFGMIGFSQKLYFGAAVHHLTQPDEGFIDVAILPRRFTFHFGALIPWGIRKEDMSWSPNFIYQIQGEATEMNLGSYIKKGPISLGTWYRSGNNRDAIISILGIEVDRYMIGYSYDFTISQLNGQTGGSHEVSVSYRLPCRPKKVRFETISCPSF